jgi:hypothetical protein
MRHDAARRGYVWGLSDDDFNSLTQAACVYCGALPRSKSVIGSWADAIWTYNGIDRVDNTQGYTKENSVSCCGRCNRWKSDATLEEFKAHVKLIYEHLEK